MKNLRDHKLFAIFTYMFFGISLVAGQTLVTGTIQNARITDHYFSTTIMNSRKWTSVNDSTKTRYLMLVLLATMPSNDGKIFASDFSIRYFHDDGSEDRVNCTAFAITKPKKDGTLSDSDLEFVIGDYAWVQNMAGDQQITLAFNIEPDVNVIDLYRLGVAEPITCRIGNERPFSVYISTNLDNNIASQTKKVIEQGGYNVIETSTKLGNDSMGISILYAEKAEPEAREISQRLMTVFGKTPTLKKMDAVSDVDVVVRIGK